VGGEALTWRHRSGYLDTEVAGLLRRPLPGWPGPGPTPGRHWVCRAPADCPRSRPGEPGVFSVAGPAPQRGSGCLKGNHGAARTGTVWAMSMGPRQGHTRGQWPAWRGRCRQGQQALKLPGQARVPSATPVGLATRVGERGAGAWAWLLCQSARPLRDCVPAGVRALRRRPGSMRNPLDRPPGRVSAMR
jgi:hypothetical protein